MNKIAQICKQYTNLSEEAIEYIMILAESLQAIANLEDADFFIDCPIEDGNGDAIVVAEAKPQYTDSSYVNTVVGLVAKSSNEPAVARTLKLGVPTRQMKAITQENQTVLQSVEPIWFINEVIGVLIMEKRLPDEMVQQMTKSSDLFQDSNRPSDISENRLSAWITENIDLAVMIVDKDGYITFRNRLAEQLFRDIGFVEDVLGLPYNSVKLLHSSVKDGQEEIYIGGSYIVVKHIPLDDDASFAVICQDISAIREKERELILKSVALKEMHHRIKNNLQTISSLLQLQIRRSVNTETQRVLRETMTRILSIAAVHEFLTQEVDDQVMLKSVINKIIINSNNFHSERLSHIKVETIGDDVSIDSDTATTIGLVVNELLENALTHAFEDHGMYGRVSIAVKSRDNHAFISVEDNGAGIIQSKDDNGHLGLDIVKTLVKDKLKGNLVINPGTKGYGTNVTFSFQLSDSSEQATGEGL